MAAISDCVAVSDSVDCEKNVTVLLDLFRFMYTSSEIDRLEQQYVQSGDAFFHVAGRGHEAVAAIAPHLIAEDWLHCHYRSKALMLARGMQPVEFFSGFFGRNNSHSRGRQMSAHLSNRNLNILSIVGPVGNSALQAVGVAAQVKPQQSQPLVLCMLGEGMTQQGEVLEALQEASVRQLPVLFIIEDNGLAISTQTSGRTFYSLGETLAEQFLGIPIHYLNGTDVVSCYGAFGEIVTAVRLQRSPAIAVVKASRLCNHTNADDQRLYRNSEEIQREMLENCPVARLETALLNSGVSEAHLSDLKSTISHNLMNDVAKVLADDNPVATKQAAAPIIPKLADLKAEYRGNDSAQRYTMIEALRAVLQHRLDTDPLVSLYGQDIEDPKGDVFGLTQGLSTRFPSRVVNSPLSESTIVGTAIGRALAGGRPVALLQFADFLPLAFNQICSELSTMYWRTDGAWQCPLIIMAPCGGYRPGLGHFHAQTFDALVAQLPGIDVYVPSNASDAAALLNTAFESARPSVFFYPKALLNDRQHTTSTDVHKQLACIGRGRVVKAGRDLTLVGWGNTVERCLRAAELLALEGKSVEVLDLRTISPWDKELVIRSARKTGRLLVVHEDNLTCGMGAEVLATVSEAVTGIHCARVARPDTPIPCNFENQLETLPSIKAVTHAAAKLLGLLLEWEDNAPAAENVLYVHALASSPSDASVTVNQWHVEPGQQVNEGDLLVEYEADKAVTELLSPYSGKVLELLVSESDTVAVGEPIVILEAAENHQVRARPVTEEVLGKAVFSALASTPAAPVLEQPKRSVEGQSLQLNPGLMGVATALGSNLAGNEAVLDESSQRSVDDIFRSTGIECRPRVAGAESVLSLATNACKTLLQQQNQSIHDIDMIVCATGTPELITPSLACQVLGQLSEQAECQAVDINAACSGYLYALQYAYDFLQSQPDAQVVILTAEVLSPVLNKADFNTAILFGDAASATLVCGGQVKRNCEFEFSRPVLSAQGDVENILSVPHRDSGKHLTMRGTKVFSMGVRKMIESLKRVLAQEQLSLDDIDQVIPHQANQRIIQAIERKLSLKPGVIYSNIKSYGNTSSNTIPIALAELQSGSNNALGNKVALTAFGGGYTYGGCVLTRRVAQD